MTVPNRASGRCGVTRSRGLHSTANTIEYQMRTSECVSDYAQRFIITVFSAGGLRCGVDQIREQVDVII